jgi:putative ABC transport system permease protein
MIGYHFEVAMRGLKRDYALTALIVTALGLGIGASMTLYSMARAMGGDPMAGESANLWTVQIDNLGPGNRRGKEPPTNLTYRDAVEFRRSLPAERKAAMYEIGAAAIVGDGNALPVSVSGRATDADFFDLFAVRFREGRAWTRAEDEAGPHVVVVTEELADRLYPRGTAVGQTLRLDEGEYRIIGVTRHWAPQPRFYDVAGSGYGLPAEFFVPFTTAISQRMGSTGGVTCVRPTGNDFGTVLQSECNWIQFWAGSGDASHAQRIRQYVGNYADEQRTAGRFSWPSVTRVHDVAGWLSYNRIVPDELRLAVSLGFGFLVVCLVNAIALMVAKVERRRRELSLRRALGANRTSVLVQCLLEVLPIGLLGGMVGVVLLIGGLASMRLMLQGAVSSVTRIDMMLLVQTLAIGIAATVAAGLFPAWKASRTLTGAELKA